MWESIKEFLGRFKLIHRKNVLASVEQTNELIISEILPTIDNIISAADTIKLNNNKTVKQIGNLAKIKHKDNKDLFVQFKAFFNEICVTKTHIVNMIKAYLPSTVVEGGISYRQAAILRFCSDINGMVMFFLDLSYVALQTENKPLNFSKKKTAELDEGIKSFAIMIQQYFNNINSTIKKISNASDEPISHNETEAFNKIRGMSTGELVRLPVTKGFIGNPLYSIGMWMVDSDIEKIEALKDKKKMLEYRLMELRLDSNGENSEKVSKMVEYYEDQVDAIEYKIKKLQES